MVAIRAPPVLFVLPLARLASFCSRAATLAASAEPDLFTTTLAPAASASAARAAARTHELGLSARGRLVWHHRHGPGPWRADDCPRGGAP